MRSRRQTAPAPMLRDDEVSQDRPAVGPGLNLSLQYTTAYQWGAVSSRSRTETLPVDFVAPTF